MSATLVCQELMRVFLAQQRRARAGSDGRGGDRPSPLLRIEDVVVFVGEVRDLLFLFPQRTVFLGALLGLFQAFLVHLVEFVALPQQLQQELPSLAYTLAAVGARLLQEGDGLFDLSPRLLEG